MYVMSRFLMMLAAVLGTTVTIATPHAIADEIAPRSNLRGKLESTNWTNIETTAKSGAKIPKDIIKLSFAKDLSFTFEITGASGGKGKVELKDGDDVILHFEEEFNGRKDHEEKIVIEKDLLTLTDTDGTTLKFDRVKPKGGLLGVVNAAGPASNLKGKIEGTAWTSQKMTTDNGVELQPGALTIDFTKDMKFTYKAGAKVWTGKYELLEGDKMKLISDQEIGGKNENIETMIIKGKTLSMIDADGTKVVFDEVAKAPLVKEKDKSNLKGKIEGTAWKNKAGEVKGQNIPAGVITLQFHLDSSLLYRAGLTTWTGKFELMEGDKIKFNTDQDLGGRKENIQTVVIEKGELLLQDSDGTSLKFEEDKDAKIERKKDDVKPAPKKEDNKNSSNLKGKIEGTSWKNKAGDVKGQNIPAGLITLKVGKDLSLEYKAGFTTWTGKVELMEGDKLKFITDQDLGGRKENIQTIVIEKDELLLKDTDGTSLKFELDKEAKKEEMKILPKIPGKQVASNLKGRIEGTKWKCVKSTINGNEIPAGAITIDFNKNMTFLYRAGPMEWTGKYELLDGDNLKLHSDQDLGGSRVNLEKVVIEKNFLTMTDPGGTALKFEKAPSDD